MCRSRLPSAQARRWWSSLARSPPHAALPVNCGLWRFGLHGSWAPGVCQFAHGAPPNRATRRTGGPDLSTAGRAQHQMQPGAPRPRSARPPPADPMRTCGPMWERGNQGEIHAMVSQQAVILRFAGWYVALWIVVGGQRRTATCACGQGGVRPTKRKPADWTHGMASKKLKRPNPTTRRISARAWTPLRRPQLISIARQPSEGEGTASRLESILLWSLLGDDSDFSSSDARGGGERGSLSSASSHLSRQQPHITTATPCLSRPRPWANPRVFNVPCLD